MIILFVGGLLSSLENRLPQLREVLSNAGILVYMFYFGTIIFFILKILKYLFLSFGSSEEITDPQKIKEFNLAYSTNIFLTRSLTIQSSPRGIFLSYTVSAVFFLLSMFFAYKILFGLVKNILDGGIGFLLQAWPLIPVFVLFYAVTLLPSIILLLISIRVFKNAKGLKPLPQ